MDTKAEKKKEFIRNIVIVLAAFAVYKVISALVLVHIGNAPVNKFATELTLLVCTLGAVVIAKKTQVLRWTSKGLGAGILAGLYMVIMPMLTLFVWILQLSLGVQTINIGAGGIVLFLLAVAMVGIAEEALFRGVLLNACLDCFGEDSVAALRRSILVSSCVFGAMHIFNIAIGASPVSALVQAINAVAVGMLFGAVYVRAGKNLWPCIILHSWLDLSAFLAGGALMGISTGATISSYSPATLGSSFIILIAALFVMRKKKLLPMTKASEKNDAK